MMLFFVLLTHVGPERKELCPNMGSVVIEELIQSIISTQFSAFDFIRNITKLHATIRLLLILVQGSIITVIIYDVGINLKMSYCLFKTLYFIT